MLTKPAYSCFPGAEEEVVQPHQSDHTQVVARQQIGVPAVGQESGYQDFATVSAPHKLTGRCRGASVFASQVRSSAA